MGFGFAALTIICLVALVGPLLWAPRLMRLPVVVGELLIGIAVGQTGLAWLDPADVTFSFLASVGFLLVMLVAGTHVPIHDPALRAGLPQGLLRAAVVGAVAVVEADVVADADVVVLYLFPVVVLVVAAAALAAADSVGVALAVVAVALAAAAQAVRGNLLSTLSAQLSTKKY